MIPLKKKKIISFVLVILAVAILLNAFSTVFTVIDSRAGTKSVVDIVSAFAFTGVVSALIVIQKKE